MVKKMIKIASNPNNILEVENYLQGLSDEYEISEDKYPDILISLTEAVNNAIIHGNNSDEKKHVLICLEEERVGLRFSVSDEGIGFNPDNIPDPTTAEHIECCGGRGVYIMKRLCDSISYKNNGRTVEMFFKLS
jgi:serine/threonine-protein kinase RsbW